MDMAELHQYALDARKHSFSIEEERFVRMHQISETCPLPSWKAKGRRGNSEQTSICGVLYEQWCTWIERLDILERKLDARGGSASKDIELEEQANAKRNEITGQCMRTLDQRKKMNDVDKWDVEICGNCGLPLGLDRKKCKVCCAVYLCCGRCEAEHWKRCFYDRVWASTDLVQSNIGSPGVATTSERPAGIFSGAMPGTNKEKAAVIEASIAFNNTDVDCITQKILEGLVDIIFGRTTMPSCIGLDDIDWRYLRRKDLQTMAEMVKVEFITSFHKGVKESKSKRGDFDSPHIYDVFTTQPRLQRSNIDLAVNLPVNTLNNLLMWRDKHNNTFPLDPPFHKYRVANLAGAVRIIESLETYLSSPAPPGTLVHYAMTRDPNLLQRALHQDSDALNLINPTIATDLNAAQRCAVGTVVVKGYYTDGFFCVHGPPGTGKVRVISSVSSNH